MGVLCSKGLQPAFACDSGGEVEGAGVGSSAEDKKGFILGVARMLCD